MNLAQTSVTLHPGVSCFTVCYPKNPHRPSEDLEASGFPTRAEAERFKAYMQACVTLATARELTPAKQKRLEYMYVNALAETLVEFLAC